MFPPCIFCNNESGSEEHLWAAWMHRLLKFGPIRVQEGTRVESQAQSFCSNHFSDGADQVAVGRKLSARIKGKCSTRWFSPFEPSC